ncbi:MFS transporter [Streptacidiphilus sp. EB129]|uniref:MFS transporter n=1 Tax=Streptacidiphilus sp. EB129 TaxID=3156262 RepID=UPI003515AFC6
MSMSTQFPPSPVRNDTAPPTGTPVHSGTIAGRPAAGRSVLGHGAGFWVIAFAFLTAMAFSAVPTPLYVLYQHRDGFSSFMTTVVFAAYAVGVIISLFLAGHASDWLGRRRVLVPALLVEAVSALVFLVWPALPGLLLARLLSGLGIGLITATATAHLSELHAVDRPGADRTRPELMSTAANLGGLGVGPLVSGALAQYVSGPLRTPYLVFMALLLVGAMAVALVPETVQPAEERPAYRPQRIAVPAAARARYFAAAGAAFASFSILGLFTSLAPGLVAGTLHHPSRALAGLVAFLVFGAAATAQSVLARTTVRRQLAAGVSLMTAGLVPLTVAVWQPDLALFLAGGAVAGAGAGVLLKGAISTVAALAAPGARGEALAGLFLIGYAGLTVPVLGVGIATQFISAKVALLGFAAAILLMVAAISSRLFRR